MGICLKEDPLAVPFLVLLAIAIYWPGTNTTGTRKLGPAKCELIGWPLMWIGVLHCCKLTDSLACCAADIEPCLTMSHAAEVAPVVVLRELAVAGASTVAIGLLPNI